MLSCWFFISLSKTFCSSESWLIVEIFFLISDSILFILFISYIFSKLFWIEVTFPFKLLIVLIFEPEFILYTSSICLKYLSCSPVSLHSFSTCSIFSQIKCNLSLIELVCFSFDILYTNFFDIIFFLKEIIY